MANQIHWPASSLTSYAACSSALLLPVGPRPSLDAVTCTACRNTLSYRQAAGTLLPATTHWRSSEMRNYASCGAWTQTFGAVVTDVNCGSCQRTREFRQATGMLPAKTKLSPNKKEIVADALRVMADHGKTKDDVLWVGACDGWIQGSWDEWLAAVPQYDTYGLADLCIVGDGWWVTRAGGASWVWIVVPSYRVTVPGGMPVSSWDTYVKTNSTAKQLGIQALQAQQRAANTIEDLVEDNDIIDNDYGD